MKMDYLVLNKINKMVCKLTYKGKRFDTKQQLLKHLQLEGVLNQLMKTKLAKGYEIMSSEQIRNKLIELGVDADVAFQISAWHGSPHSFNRFSTEFVGTGEGAQAFGWGLYFTDLESIARKYADDLSKQKYSIDGEVFTQQNLNWGEDATLHRISYDVEMEGFSMEEAIDREIELKKHHIANAKRLKDKEGENDNKRLLEFAKSLKGKKIGFAGKDRHLYKVTLHKGKQPSEYTWLEWDKPFNQNKTFLIIQDEQNLSEESKFELTRIRLKESNEIGQKQALRQVINDYKALLKTKDGESYGYGNVMTPEIRNKYNNVIKELQGILTYKGEFLNLEGKTGNSIYKELAKKLGSDKSASLLLLENGIDGIKYPAESISRGATSDTARGFNYVVFDENAISIEEIIQFQKAGITLLPNGFYYKGKVYINQDTATLDTPIHEFSHAYTQLLKNERPEFYQEGLNLIEKEGQQYVDFVKKNQPNLEGEALYEEALAQAVGDAGAKLIKAEKSKGLKNWLTEAWNSIKQMLGLSSYTIDQVRNMSLQEYTKAVAVDLLRGESLVQDNNVEEVFNKLEELQTLELEEDEVRYPKYEEDDVTDLANLGDGVYLQINKREELPLAGSFEIFITDYNNDILGFIRGNKSEDTVSFNLIHLDENYRGQGIGKKVYKYFLNDYNIKSDSEITADTESLYKSLIKDNYKAVITKDNRVEIIKYSNKTQNNQKSIPEQFQINATEQELQQIKEQAIADGTFMKAPNGKDTNLTERQWLQVRSKAFIDNFFGDWINDPENASKVVDENGEPMVVWHGTNAEFNEFSTNYNRYTKGTFFSTKFSTASIYGNVKPFFINSRNIKNVSSTLPGVYDLGDIENTSFDGLWNRGTNEIVVGNPNQIKSATDNVGTFSSESNDIRYQISPTETQTIFVEAQTSLINSYQSTLDNGIVVEQLYENEQSIKNKIDSCEF